MQRALTKGQTICGLDALEARRILKRFDDPGLSLKEGVKRCDLAELELAEILTRFTTEGYLNKNELDGDQTWSVTSKARRLFDKAPKSSIKRTLAEKKLELFLNQINLLNADAYYLWRVKRAAVFGSYLGDKTLLGDLDVAIELARRESDVDVYNKLARARLRRAHIQGQSFANITLELLHPVLECYKFLKAGVAKLNITELTDIEEMRFPFSIIYESDDKDFASSKNPEELRPYLISPRVSISMSALRRTTVEGIEFCEGDPIRVLPKTLWSVPVNPQAKDSDDWVFTNDSLPAQSLSSKELLDIAALILQPHSIVFHCRKAEAEEYCKQETCSTCGIKNWIMDMGIAPVVTCRNCGHVVEFVWKTPRTVRI